MNRKSSEGTSGRPDIYSLDKGCTFKYGYSTWTVLENYEYDWGEGAFSKEYKVSDGQAMRYLAVEEEEGEPEVVFYEEIPREEFEKSLPKPLHDGQEMPKSLFFNGRGYFFDEESLGYFCDLSQQPENWEEFIAWDFYDKTEKYVLSIEQWDEDEFEVFYGEVVEAYEIRDIIQI